jgi:hypothetical protein
MWCGCRKPAVQRTVPTELSASLRADLAAAAEDAEAYHHDLCQLFAPAAPEICTCAGPRLLRDLAAALEVGWVGPESVRAQRAA